VWPSEPHAIFAVNGRIPHLPVIPSDLWLVSRDVPHAAAIHTETQLLARGIRKSADVVRRLELPPSDGSMEQTLTLCREVSAFPALRWAAPHHPAAWLSARAVRYRDGAAAQPVAMGPIVPSSSSKHKISGARVYTQSALHDAIKQPFDVQAVHWRGAELVAARERALCNM
jgi:hypothetical protein